MATGGFGKAIYAELWDFPLNSLGRAHTLLGKVLCNIKSYAAPVKLVYELVCFGCYEVIVKNVEHAGLHSLVSPCLTTS